MLRLIHKIYSECILSNNFETIFLYDYIVLYFNYDIDWMNDILCVQDLRIFILLELWLQYSTHSFLYYIFIIYIIRAVI